MARTATIAQGRGWWAARSVREKRLLLAAAVLLTLALLWLAIIRPLTDARANAEARLNAAVTDLARARAEVAANRLGAAAAGANPVALPLDSFLQQSGGEQGFTDLQVVASAPNRATISMGQVRPPAFFGWIGQLEVRGVAVESLSARANQDQTIAVEAVLRAGGR